MTSTSRPAARDRRSQSSTLDRPHTLDRTWPSCIIAPPLGKGRSGVPFRRNSAEIAAHCAILPRLGKRNAISSVGAIRADRSRCAGTIPLLSQNVAPNYDNLRPGFDRRPIEGTR
jgi:hypothetical protein